MKTVAEYRAYAAESRRLVASVSRPEDKQALERLAQAWDHLADEREARLLQQIDGDTLID
jgi:alpha-D-ribose 1-methylphosphonate 5-triphosphate synthase subunit PhnH